MVFLKKAFDKGIRNIEMESNLFAAMCNRAGVKSAIICVALLNRLNGDQITLTADEKSEYEQRPWHLVLEYIKRYLNVK